MTALCVQMWLAEKAQYLTWCILTGILHKHHQFDFCNYCLMNCYGKKSSTAMTSAQTVNSSWPQEALVDLGQVLWWDLCLKLNKPFSILIIGHGELFMDSVVQPCCCGLKCFVATADKKYIAKSSDDQLTGPFPQHTCWNWIDYIWSNSCFQQSWYKATWGQN